MSLLKMENIRKSFDGVQVLNDVSLSVDAGETHALLGENGAGKSTLMNILAGVYTKDSGTIVFDGKICESMTIPRSEKLGIAFVHQELNIFNELKAYENIFLTREHTIRFGKLDKKRMIKETEDLFSVMGVHIDPEETVSHLKTSQKQLIEIAKALFLKARLLILDEPTTSLNTEEVEHLFGLINRLKSNGTSFIFISHKMPEIFKIADRYTVFRNGCYVGSGMINETDPEGVTKMMVGENYNSKEIYVARKSEEVILDVRNLSGNGFKNVNLTAEKGQIIGLTGLQGSGSGEFMQGLFGTGKVTGGEIYVSERKIRANSVHASMKSKIAMLASNRKENSVIPDMSLLENMYIAEHTLSSPHFHINKKKESGRLDYYRKLLNIRMQSGDQSVVSLSGGNQQKVFLARWLNTQAEILLLDNPTQGIDVGAKAEIYKLILELAQTGKTILINTLEIPELQKVADLCAVFYEGSIIKILDHDSINETSVMMYSTNAVNAGKENKI